MKRIGYWLPVMLLAFTDVTVGPASEVASGAPANCSNQGYGRHGWGVVRAAKVKVSGAQANIEVRRADLCDPSGNDPVGVAGVVTLQPPGTESSDRFARAGKDSVNRYHVTKVDDSHMRTWTDPL